MRDLKGMTKAQLTTYVRELESQIIELRAGQLPLALPPSDTPLSFKAASAIARDLAVKTGISHMPVRTTNGYVVQSTTK